MGRGAARACAFRLLRIRFSTPTLARAVSRAELSPICVFPRDEASPPVRHSETSVVTIERFIIEQERLVPCATGDLSGILYDMALAAKMIANKVRSAGLADILGSATTENIQGEIQQKLDIFANETIIKAMDHSRRLCAIARARSISSFPTCAPPSAPSPASCASDPKSTKRSR